MSSQTIKIKPGWILKKIAQTGDLILVKGSIPGGDNGLLFIRRSLKKPEGIKIKVVDKTTEKKKDPLKASKQAAAGGAKKK